MGFSLQAFINELYGIIRYGKDPIDTCNALQKAIEEGAKYAAQCGQITLPKDE